MSGKDNTPDSSRREFVRVSLLVGLGAACAAAGSVPLFSQVTSLAGAPIALAPIDALSQAEGEFEPLSKPGRFIALNITLMRRDAGLNVQRAQTVYLSRTKSGQTADCFLAFSPVCPHAGCTVEYKDNAFGCPCHNASFDAKGARVKGPSPRDLDPLELSVAPRDGKPWLHLAWRDYVTGIEQRVARS
ncbi:menaquinol-cytochrome c reductase iron-sulfur subunit [Planctomycetaceae bacterium]|nr:menaquinol-cytochrome c reductase iron-sulfur subunit [Planctomycetaceae bacterium]